MLSRPALKSRLLLTACALALEVLHLGWELTHGGVPAHHLLNNPDLPSISNWWGLAVVPLLVWLLVGRIQRRAATLVQEGSRQRFHALARTRFAGALLWGAALALAFSFDSPAVTPIFVGAFVAGLFLHAYRAEYVLGFALGLTFTFGAVLPVLITSIIAGVSFVVHLLVGAALRLARGGHTRGAGLP